MRATMKPDELSVYEAKDAIIHIRRSENTNIIIEDMDHVTITLAGKNVKSEIRWDTTHHVENE